MNSLSIIITSLATIFFFLFFCYIIYSTFKKGAKEKLQNYAKIPFKDEKNNLNH
jgi:cbb3-type cytochrome oxidase subunit 3